MRSYLNGQRLAGELVAHTQNPQILATQALVLQEVEAPDRVGLLCYQGRCRFTGAQLLLASARRDAQTRFSPEPPDALVVERFAFLMNQTVAPSPLARVLSKLVQALLDLVFLGQLCLPGLDTARWSEPDPPADRLAAGQSL